MSKPYKVKKPKEPKETAVQVKPWWFLVILIPVVLLVGILYHQFNVIGERRQQESEARAAMLSAGGYENFDTLGVDVYLPSSTAEETPLNGASYSKLRVQRYENGNPMYAFGVIAIPNESGKSYDINNNFTEIVDLYEQFMIQAMVDVYGGIHPSCNATINRRTLFDTVDAIEEYGTININFSYLEAVVSEEDPNTQVVGYNEEDRQMKYYSDTIIVNNRPVVAWGIWEYDVPVGQIDVRQSVVDALASLLGVESQDTSNEPLDALSTTESTLIYSNNQWYNDVTGELVEEIPSIDDPDFAEKYLAYIEQHTNSEAGTSLNDEAQTQDGGASADDGTLNGDQQTEDGDGTGEGDASDETAP